MHPALTEGRAAVITGGASGIGLAAAKRFASLGMKICLADLAVDASRHADIVVARDFCRRCRRPWSLLRCQGQLRAI